MKHQHRCSGASRMRRKGSAFRSVPGEGFYPVPGEGFYPAPTCGTASPPLCRAPAAQAEFPAGVPGGSGGKPSPTPHPHPRAESMETRRLPWQGCNRPTNQAYFTATVAEYRGRTTFCRKIIPGIPGAEISDRTSFPRSHLRDLELETADSLFIQTVSTGVFS